MEYKALIVKCSNCGLMWLAHRKEWNRNKLEGVMCPECLYMDERKILKRQAP